MARAAALTTVGVLGLSVNPYTAASLIGGGIVILVSFVMGLRGHWRDRG